MTLRNIAYKNVFGSKDREKTTFDTINEDLEANFDQADCGETRGVLEWIFVVALVLSAFLALASRF